MPRFLEPYENIALSLIFEVMGESRFNRTHNEYIAIAARLPHLKKLRFQVNVLWKKYRTSLPPRSGTICYFRQGDLKARYGDYPEELSIETIRTALIVSGMRTPIPRRRRAA